MSLKQSLLVICLALQGLMLLAQISVEKGLQSERYGLGEVQSSIVIPAPDLESIVAEDKIEDQFKNIAFRFGIPLSQNIDVFHRAEMVQLSDGLKIYRLRIQADGALSLNFTFSQFELSKNSFLHIYDGEKRQILGAFGEHNNREDGEFATSLIFSNDVVFEIQVRGNVDKNKLFLENVIYGYRGLDKDAMDLNESGSCNININCPEGSPYQDEKRAVVMILTASNNRFCTGVLVNNVKEDGTPYLLSADHCGLSTNNVFAFNYESAFCSPTRDSTLSHTINGITIRARNSKSDFILGELSSTPPANFNAYYAGWNCSGEVPAYTSCIHHPRGDVKKVSLSDKPAKTSGYYISGTDHWKVDFWDAGTTEDGSSGSPLLDQFGRVVGQLHGGDASCTRIEEDYYGKFSVSWDDNSDIQRQLKHWLDPDNSGANVMHGMDPSASISDFDLAALGFSNYNFYICGSGGFAPELVVRNRGNLTVDSFEVAFTVNNVIDHVKKFNTSVSSGSTFLAIADNINLASGFYAIGAEVRILGQSDGNTSNDRISMELQLSNDPIELEFIFQSDDYGDEFSWDIQSSTGAVLHSRGGYPEVPGGMLHRDTICLTDGCYSLNVYDRAFDGICCAFGQGWYALVDISSGDTIVVDRSFTGADSSHNFCLGDSCNISARAYISEPSIDSSNGSIRLDMIMGIPPFTANWSNGDTGLIIMDLDTGTYSVNIKDGIGCSSTLEYRLGVGTNVNEVQDISKISIYPNPANTQVYIHGLYPNESYLIRIIDINGRLLNADNLQSPSDVIELDVSNLYDGFYFLQVEGSTGLKTEKLLIRRN